MNTIRKFLRPDKYLAELINTSRDSRGKIEILTQQMEVLHNEIIITKEALVDETKRNTELLIAQRYNLEVSKKKLIELRTTSEYKKVFNRKDPLITVRIATYNRSKLLVERAIPSVLNQSYQNFEIVIVGDHCTDDTEYRIKKINDRRIRFINLEQHTYYPEDKFNQWLVVGAAPANEAVRNAKGDWIATLDDDDEYCPNHLETLINLARDTKSELVYSALESIHQNSKEKKVVWSEPPKQNHFSMMSALYLRGLAGIFQTDEQGWVTRMPQDWYLCRRMLEAGVRYSSTKTVTGRINLITYDEKKD